MTRCISPNCLMRRLTSWRLAPDPRAIRRRRDPSRMAGSLPMTTKSCRSYGASMSARRSRVRRSLTRSDRSNISLCRAAGATCTRSNTTIWRRRATCSCSRWIDWGAPGARAPTTILNVASSGKFSSLAHSRGQARHLAREAVSGVVMESAMIHDMREAGTASPLAGASLNLEPENKDGRSQRGCR